MGAASRCCLACLLHRQGPAIEAVSDEALAGKHDERPDGSLGVTTPEPQLTRLREDLLNWLAHEIPTPLSTARLTVEMMRRHLEGGDARRARHAAVRRC